MRIAVTGASGFIGRHVVAELERRQVSSVLVSREPGKCLAGTGHILVPMDITDAPIDAFDRMGQPAALIHLAWGGLPHYGSLHHVERELPAHYMFLKRLVESGLRKLVIAGTCLEYGLQSGALAETHDTRPSNPYALAKDVLRRQLECLQAKVPFQLTWARLFYMYGEGQPSTSLFPQLVSAVGRGDREFPMSGGEQLRDYLPVGEVARHLVALATDDRDHGIVNVCAGTPVSVRALVERWIAERGWTIAPALGRYPYPDYEPLAFWGDAQKLHALMSHEFVSESS